jgi:hypothetical protein
MVTSAPTSAITAARAPMTGKAAVEQMADDMRIINTRNGNVTTDDLSLLGWTGKQIAEHGAAAREAAAAASLVMV